METTLTHVRLLGTTQILKEWRQEVNENFWIDDAQKQVKKLMKSVLEDTLEQDLEYDGSRWPPRDPSCRPVCGEGCGGQGVGRTIGSLPQGEYNLTLGEAHGHVVARAVVAKIPTAHLAKVL